MPCLAPPRPLPRTASLLRVWVLVLLAFGAVMAASPSLATAAPLAQPQLPCGWIQQDSFALSPTVGGWDAGGVLAPTVVETDEGFAMGYVGLAEDGSEAGIGWATSADGRQWAKAGAPILAPGPAGAWDASVGWPSMVRAGDGYHLWYRGRAEGRPGAIGYAFSEDGRSWRKEGGAPVLEPVGEAERGGLAFPSVVEGGRSGVARFQMWYLAGDGVTYRVRHATSVDGRVWQRQEANTVLEAGPIGAWDWPWLQRPTVLLEPSGYLMAYGALGLPGQRHRIGFASSDDGMIWRRESRVLDGRGLPYGEGDLAHPSLLVDGEGRMHLWHNVEEGGEPWIAKLEGVPCTAPRESRIYLPLTVSAAPGLGLDACAAEYRETFERPDGDWDRYEREGTTVDVRGGAYHMIVRDDAYLWQAGAGAVAQDFHLEVEARPLDRGQGVYGLYFGAVGDEREYRLLVYESEFTLLRMTGEKEPAVLYDWTPSAHIKTPPSTNRLEIRRSGDRIAFSSNGRLVVEVRDDVLRRPGDIGLLAGAARDERFEVRYDNFVLREPDCRPGR